MRNRLLSMLLCLCMLISLIPAIPIFAAGTGVPVCEHSYTAVVTPPTCAAKGYTTYTCSKCGSTFIADEVDSLPHRFVDGVCAECGRKAVTVRFDCDEGVSVNVYETQDVEGAHEDGAKTAYPRNADSGKIDLSGDGQVNFTVQLLPGYELDSVTAEPEDAFKNLKLPFETGVIDGYRLTRISDDVTVTIKVKKYVAPDVLTVRFECDEGVSVTTYEKQSRTGAFEENATRAIVRNGVTGEPDVSGVGQVNFLVVVSPGYRFEDISLNPVTAFEDVRFPNNLGIENAFRITGISGDVAVKVNATPVGVHACVHTYVPKITPPTCTEPGYTTYTCSRCGESYTDDKTAPTGHSFGDQGFCLACGMLASRIQFVCDPGVSVSVARTESGRVDENVNVAYPRDSSTGEIRVDGSGQVNFTVNVENGYRLESVVPAPAESIGRFQQPGETLTGSGYCLNGITGDVTVTVRSSVIDPDSCAHAYEAAVTPPTCTAEGYTTYTCPICGDCYRADRKPKVAHSYAGGACSVCGERRVTVTFACSAGVSVSFGETRKDDGLLADKAVSAHPRNADTGLEDGSGAGHVNFTVRLSEGYRLESISAAPSDAYKSLKGPVDTGVENGYRVANVAGNCTVTVKAVKAGCEHSYLARITAPTCTEMGYTVYTCTKCGDTDVRDEIPALGHDYSAEVTPPTCTAGGYTTHTCSRCGDSYVSDKLPALGHDFRTTVTEPTCTEKGYTTYACTRCRYAYAGSETAARGHEYRAKVTVPTCTAKGCTSYVCAVCGDSYIGSETPALGHDYVAEITAPTCTETGYTAYTCSACGDSYIGSETPALGHEYIAEITAPTCTEKGYTVYTCPRCGDSYLGNETAALGHDYTAELTPPACTEKGHTVYTCQRCGDSYIGNETQALGHDYTAELTSPTCTEEGYTVYTCRRCGDSFVGDETAALGHDWGEGAVTKQPTETIRGERTYTCSRCGETRTEDIQPLSHVHKFTAAVTPPTCTEEGCTIHTCACGESYTDARVPALGHQSSAAVTAPTCTEKGRTVYTCTRCGAVYTDDEKPALGHDYQAAVTAPTCTGRGYTTYICSRCGEVRTGDETAALGHDYRAAETAPTCTEAGYTVYTCARCGDSYRGDEKPALGHDDRAAVTAPTCTGRGYTTFTCSRCGAVRTGDETAPLGHDYRASETAPTCTEMGFTTHTCAICGDEYTGSEIPALGHDWDGGIVTVQPTETAAGERTYTCARCGLKRTERIPELVHEHSYDEAVTAPTCTAKGYTTHTCACGESYTDSEVPALGHDYRAAATPPTCTEGGYTVFTCTRCGDSYRGDEKDALGHDYTAAVTAPTCTEAGYTVFTCSRCGDMYIGDESAALGHDWDVGVITVEPTETESGERVYTCARCGEKRAEYIPELSHVHVYTDVVTAPTCTAEGYTTHTCACGSSYADSEVPALGHDYREAVTSPTCTEGGYTVYTCARCGDSHRADEKDALGHDYRAAVTAPTCTEAGYTVYTCARCGGMYIGDETAALGHDWDGGTVTVEPTETEPGERVYTCARCGEMRSEYIPELSHVHVYTDVVTAPTCTAEGYTTHTCACGSSYADSEVPALGHDYRDGVCTRCQSRDPDAVPPAVEPPRFEDVMDDSQYFYRPVFWAVENEITNGATPTTFNPDAGCTRAQVVTFLWRAAGKPEPMRSTNPFEDVQDDQYYTKAILWAVEQDITNGTGEGKFNPGATCTRGQIVTFLWRYFEETEPENDENPFEDVMEGQYYTKAILWAVEDAITKGTSAEKFSPNATCTRGQIVTFLYRAMAEEP